MSEMSLIECFSDACAINMGDSVILTGGVFAWYSQTKVTELRMDGSYTKLPELNQGRYSHGCASYLDEYGNKVTIVNSVKLLITVIYKVLLVVGGLDLGFTYSTEIQLNRKSAWKTVSPFPFASFGVNVRTINNMVHLAAAG